jgi:lipid-binding SYLF domain-containing protein
MKRSKSCLAILLGLWMGTAALGATESKEAERLRNATFVINEVMQTPENGIPMDLLNRAVCVGIVPSEKKGAFIVGGQFGRGALVCRKGGNGPWWAPSMFTLGGASYGLQIGGQATDIVFIVMNTGGVRKLLASEVKLGADASVAAGPVGRKAEAATDVLLHSEILSYSRSRGLFAGISLSGAVIRQDDEANKRLYGRYYTPEQILIDAEVNPPDAAKPLDSILTRFSPHGGAPFVTSTAAK